MRIRPKRTARENAARLLPRLAENLFQAGDEAESENNAKKLHPFRILTKRFRYALEYFQPCYGAVMDQYLQSIKDLQEVLGEVNDCCSSQRLFEGLAQRAANRAGYKPLLAALNGRDGELAEKFRAHWRNSYGPAARKKFLRYLARPPKRKPPVRSS